MKLDPAELAKMDQHVAVYETAVDALIVSARNMIALSGRTEAVALMAMSLRIASKSDDVLGIAAVSLIKLAERGGNA